MANPKTVWIQALPAHFAGPSIELASLTVVGIVRVEGALGKAGDPMNLIARVIWV